MHIGDRYYGAGAAAPEQTDELFVTYLEGLMRTVGRLDLAGIDPKAANSDDDAQINLDAVYTALLTRSPAHSQARRGAKGALPTMSQEMLPGGEEEIPRLSAVAQLDSQKRLVLLGDPGGGKSSFVNFVALCLAGEWLAHPQINCTLLTTPLPSEDKPAATENDSQESPPPAAQPWQHGALLPVRIILRDFAARHLPPPDEPASARHLWHYLRAELVANDLEELVDPLRHHLRQHGAIVFFDGLDEVSEANQRRRQIKQAVESFCNNYGKCRVLVTSRTYAYQRPEWQLEGFAQAVLEPFTDQQIRHFVERWYRHTATLRAWSAEDADGRARRLQDEIFQRPRLRDLVGSPLLLTLTASLHAWRGRSLPQRRAELYEEAVQLLLDRWEQRRVVYKRNKEIDPDRTQPSLVHYLNLGSAEPLRHMLEKLAFDAQRDQPAHEEQTADIAQLTLLDALFKLKPDANLALLVEYLSQRTGLLLPRGVEIYAFPHRTFQEYLSACHLTRGAYPDNVAQLVRNDPNRWREVTLLAGARAASGASANIWSLVETLCDYPADAPDCTAAGLWGAQLAGQALLESDELQKITDNTLPTRDKRKLAAVRSHLVQLLRSNLPAPERVLAGRNLGKLGDPRLTLSDPCKIEFCTIAAGPFLMGSNQGEEGVYDDETLQHEVDLPYPYWISRYPVTNAQFAAFAQAGGYKEPRYWCEAIANGRWRDGQIEDVFYTGYDQENDRYSYKSTGWRAASNDYGEPYILPNHPVVGITWYEALAFTRWLHEQLAAAGQLPAGWRVTLPSEAEWEKAARGGLEVEVGGAANHNPRPARRYPWGDTPEADEVDTERANYDASKVNATNAIGCYATGASPYGVEEMSGNAWEWTRSLWGSKVQNPEFVYPYRLEGGHEALDAGDEVLRVTRGSSYYNDEVILRATFRSEYDPCVRVSDLGLRVVVLSPSPLISDPL